MLLFFTPLHILIATIVGFFFGALWYSPFLFLKAWLKGEGLELSQVPKHTKMYMIQTHLYSFVAHALMASVLAIMFDLLLVTTLSLALCLGLLLTFGFIVTTRFIDMVYTTRGKHYEIESQVKFLVSAGYYLLVMSIMSSVLFWVTMLPYHVR